MVPWFLEHVALPIGLLPTRSRFWSLFRQMRRYEYLPAAEARQLQLKRLQELLQHAEQHVPYYRQRWAEAGVGSRDVRTLADLPRLPRTTKVDIQQHFPESMVDERSDRARWQYVSTRGTANRLVAIHNFAKRDLVRAAQLRSLYLSDDYRLGHRTAEIPPDACSVVCGEEGETSESVATLLKQMTQRGAWRDPHKASDLRGAIEHRWLLRRRVLPPFGAVGSNPADDQLKQYVAEIECYRPRVLKALPTYLHQIARYVVRHGHRPLPVRVIKPFGGSVSRVMRTQIEQGFAGEFREDYGSAELGAIACDCRQNAGMHIFSDLFVVEVVRGEASCGAGQRGRLLITDLGNLAMPLIRYDIGDVGHLLDEPCPCGRTAPRLMVAGRVEDLLVTAAGAAIPSDAVCDALYALPAVDQFQLVEEEPGEFELLIVPSRGSSQAVEQAVAALHDLLGADAVIHPRVVSTIAAEESGKFRFVKSATFARYDRETSSKGEGVSP